MPLVQWTFAAASQAKLLPRSIVTTDDEKVRDLAKDWTTLGISTLYPRPKKLSEDVPTERVNRYVLDTIEKEGEQMDAVCLLQPTTPFRWNSQIDKCIEAWRQGGHDTVFTVAPVTQRPEWMFREWPDHLEPYLGVAPSMENCVSQNLEGLVYPTGGVYVISRDTVKSMKIFGERCLGVRVPWQSAIDIEEEQDLIYAEKVWEAMQSA